MESKPLLGEDDDHTASGDPHSGGGPRASNWQSAANIIKSFIGVGILGLPYALRLGGIWFGVLGMLVIAFLSNYTMKILVATKYKYQESDPKCHTYIDVGWHALGRIGTLAVQFAQVGSQLGTCSVYVVYIATTLNQIHGGINKRLYMLMVAPAVWLLAQVRNYKYLSPTSFLGIVAVVTSIVVVSYYGLSDPHPPQHLPFIHVPAVAGYFGMAVFALEGILLALPLEASMIRRADYSFVLDLCMVIVALLYIGFAMIGYLSFGDAVMSAISGNIPSATVVDRILLRTVQALLILELLCSYPLQLAPVITMIEEAFVPRHRSRYELWRTVVRTLLVIASIVLAVSFKQFAVFAGLVGGVCLSVAGFILPSLFYLIAFRGTLGWAVQLLNYFCILFGVFALVTSTTVTVACMVNENAAYC